MKIDILIKEAMKSEISVRHEAHIATTNLKCDFSLESFREVKSCLEVIMMPPPPPPPLPPPPPHCNIDVDRTKTITEPDTCTSSFQRNVLKWQPHKTSASLTTGNSIDANQTLEKTNFTSSLTTEAATERPVKLPITTTWAKSVTTMQAPFANPISSFATKRPPIDTKWTSLSTHRLEANVFDSQCTPVNSAPSHTSLRIRFDDYLLHVKSIIWNKYAVVLTKRSLLKETVKRRTTFSIILTRKTSVEAITFVIRDTFITVHAHHLLALVVTYKCVTGNIAYHVYNSG
ncbi:hypothetical protein CHS0354_031379 [Potamilus streckersoni]|uniref:Uncharacterized protein n=1 Tax=Potamilus streckersoni TaxID=2493646 RepID=A0AAE0SKP6_9BIVA|nr:hypothetical protein CHS0354_031379 [Potamilus streckersoni]